MTFKTTPWDHSPFRCKDIFIALLDRHQLRYELRYIIMYALGQTISAILKLKLTQF